MLSLPKHPGVQKSCLTSCSAPFGWLSAMLSGRPGLRVPHRAPSITRFRVPECDATKRHPIPSVAIAGSEVCISLPGLSLPAEVSRVVLTRYFSFACCVMLQPVGLRPLLLFYCILLRSRSPCGRQSCLASSSAPFGRLYSRVLRPSLAYESRPPSTMN